MIRARGWLALVAAVHVTACARTRAPRGDDEISPPPSQLPYVDVKLPRSTRAYRSYETGVQHTMLQARFEIEARDLPELAPRLPCRLGPVEEGEPEFAHIGTNDRAWYVPETVRKYRGCDYHHGLTTASFLVDVGDAERITIYAVIALE
jgi:hypothetical protein